MPEQTADSVNPSSAASQETPPGSLTPELIKEVSEKVYAMMLKDMKIARERFRFSWNRDHKKGR